MVDPGSNHHGATNFFRWTARIWSIISLTLILGFIAGEGIHFTKRYEALGFLFFPVGISVGMVLAWWKERLGGSIMVASLLIFYCLHFAMAGKFPHGWGWLVFAFPGFLFLAADDLQRRCGALRK